jgi:hypothetical protein
MRDSQEELEFQLVFNLSQVTFIFSDFGSFGGSQVVHTSSNITNSDCHPRYCLILLIATRMLTVC